MKKNENVKKGDEFFLLSSVEFQQQEFRFTDVKQKQKLKIQLEFQWE